MFRKILVTGGSGLLGTGLKDIAATQYLDREFIFLSSKQCNLTNLDAVLDCVAKHGPEAILHFAALSGGIEYSTKFPATLLRDNVLMNLNVLEAARLLGVKKVALTLSTGTYPVNAPNPIREEFLHEGAPHETNYSYAFAKRLIDPSIRAYRTEYGLNAIGLAVNGIFGPNMNFRAGESIMVAALIRRFYENRNNDSKIVIWGDGSALREYTYSQDLARGFMWCLDHYDRPQFLNIGSTEEHSVKETAFMIAEILGVDAARIEFDTTKPGGIYKKSTDNSKFTGLSSFQYTPFRNGLEKTIAWFVANYGTPRVRL
ncbi:MAG: NAD-dependent epimerase/dehydratase family protein [Verrucomicrobiota bacterium]